MTSIERYCDEASREAAALGVKFDRDAFVRLCEKYTIGLTVFYAREILEKYSKIKKREEWRAAHGCTAKCGSFPTYCIGCTVVED